MLKRITCGLAALLCAHAVHAEDFYKPKLEAEAYAGFMEISDEGLNDDDVRKPKGTGFGLRVSGFIFPNAQAWVEGSQHDPDVKDVFDDGAQDRLKVSLQQIRAGVRVFSFSKSDQPVYTSLGAEYLRARQRATIKFGPGTSEADIGEDPAFDADDTANPIRETTTDDFALGHLRAGYRSAQAHFYADVAYGASSDATILEFTTGLAYNLVSDLSLFGEYRNSRIREDGNNTAYRDLRIGIGKQF